MTERVPVVVIGGGIAGLTAAYRLRQAGIDAVVLESADRAGGRMQSVEVGGLMLEGGPDSLVARKPWAVDLCKELGIELVPTGASGVHLWTEHGLVPAIKDAPFGIPGDIGDVLRWPGLSSAGRRRALQDLLRSKRKDGAEESLGGLLRRRLGDEATDRAIAPVLAGLYAGDVDRLSARATFPELERWEASQGSLIRGSQAASRNARNAPTGPMFVKPRAGVAALPEALAGALGDRVRAGARATAVTPASGGAYRVEIDGAEPVEAAHVVVAAPAPIAAELLSASAPTPAADLAAIEYVSTSVVLLVYPEGTGDGLPEGTGFVVPRGMAPMTACSWINRKWPDASFGTRAVLRCFVGAAGEEEVIDAPDADIIAACASHLAAALPLPTEPVAATVVRWPKSMPQYVVGHQDRVARIREGLPAGIVVIGNAYDGVGIPDSVRSGEQAAEQIAAALTSSAAPDKETV